MQGGPSDIESSSILPKLEEHGKKPISNSGNSRVVYWRGKHWDGCSGSSGINQGHADTVQGLGRTVPVRAVSKMEEGLRGSKVM